MCRFDPTGTVMVTKGVCFVIALMVLQLLMNCAIIALVLLDGFYSELFESNFVTK